MILRKNGIINLIIILSFMILSVLSVGILIIHNTLFSGADLLFHIKRILELNSDIYNGNIFPGYSFNQFHGSAVMILYPYFNLLPIFLISMFIRSKVLVIYTWIILNIFLSLCISFYSSKKFSKSKITSYLFAISYSLSSTYFSYILYNSDFGTITVIAVLPLAIFGFLNLLKYDSGIELTFGLILIIFSHVLSAFMVSGLLLFLLLINYKYINKKLLFKLSKIIIVITVVTGFIWIRAFKFLLLNHNISSIGFPKMQGTSCIHLLLMGITNSPSYDLSWFPIISIIIFPFFYKKSSKFIKQMYFISLLIIFICSDFFPWKLIQATPLKIIRIFQFSWRFYLIPQLFLCYILSYIITQYFLTKYIINMLLIVSIVFIFGSQFFMQINTIKNNYNDPSITTCKNLNNIFLFHIRKFNGFTRPEYKIENNHQFYYINKLDGNGTRYFHDYYPTTSKNILSHVNNNMAIFGSTRYYFKHVGYNKYLIDNTHKLGKLVIPIFMYKDEHIQIFINGKRQRYSTNKNHLIELNKLYPNKNYIYIKQI